MNREDRAKQFAPFDALKGLSEALRRKEIECERTRKKDILEDKGLEIQKNLFKVNKGSIVSLRYYDNGVYKKIDGVVEKKDLAFRFLMIGEVKIFFDDLDFIKIKKN